MGLFSFFRKQPPIRQTPNNPYKNEASNLIYNLLFCDDIQIFKENTKPPYTYPFSILFEKNSTTDQLQKIVGDPESDPRTKILAYNQLRERGIKSDKKELLAVIVEVGLDSGLDVLASFKNGTARYINQTGAILVWETTTDDSSNKLTQTLFNNSQMAVEKIGPWDKPRRQYPAKGMARISFLVSDGLYFGEGPVDVLFNDPIAGSALESATELMMYLTAKNNSQTSR